MPPHQGRSFELPHSHGVVPTHQLTGFLTRVARVFWLLFLTSALLILLAGIEYQFAPVGEWISGSEPLVRSVLASAALMMVLLFGAMYKATAKYTELLALSNHPGPDNVIDYHPGINADLVALDGGLRNSTRLATVATMCAIAASPLTLLALPALLWLWWATSSALLDSEKLKLTWLGNTDPDPKNPDTPSFTQE